MKYEERRRREKEQFDAAFAAKAKINKVFAALRKKGFMARQNFMCCSTCACSRAAHDVETLLVEGKPAPQGAIFYTKQSGFFNGRPGSRGTKVQKMRLTYGQVYTKHGALGVDTKKAGELLRDLLEAEGLHVEWDGDPEKSMLIDPCPNLWSDEPRTRFDKVVA